MAVFVALSLSPTAMAALPKFAFSVPPAQTGAEGVKAAETCGLKGKISGDATLRSPCWRRGIREIPGAGTGSDGNYR